jgi:MFS family permease
LREGAFSREEIEAELNDIKQNVEAEKLTSSSWTALFTQRDLFSRLWRAALLQFMAQMCGATAMKYYLPTLFAKLGLGHQLSLLVGGIESTLKIGCTIIDMQLIDRFGRRVTLITGCVVMSLAMLVICLLDTLVMLALTSTSQINGALPQAYPRNVNHAADYACIVFIFFFTFGYSFGFGPAAWVYGAEVCHRICRFTS